MLPTAIGASINVADSTALAALSLDGLTVGTQAWNIDLGAYFTLTQSARTSITLETTDGYVSPAWTLANATFTGFEGCTLVLVLQAPNVAFSKAYVIDTVSSATVVTVVGPPAGATTGELFGSAVLYNDALVTDSVVAANGVTGLRWVLSAAATAEAPANATTFTAALNVATVALKGLESTADKIAISGIMFSSWAGARAQEMLAVVPELTEFVPLDSTHFPATTSAPPTFDASVEGGGVAPLASASVLIFGRGLAQTMKTGKGAIVFRAQFPTAPSTGQTAQIGMCNAAEDHYIWIKRKGNADDTHYVLEVVGGATTTQAGTIVADTSWHNMMLAWNGTNVRMYIDNVLAATAVLTNAVDGSMFPFMFNTESTKVKFSKGLYGYVAV